MAVSYTHLDVYKRQALERTNQKFIHRFNYMEQKAKEQGKTLKNMTLEEMEAIWQEAKQQEK